MLRSLQPKLVGLSRNFSTVLFNPAFRPNVAPIGQSLQPRSSRLPSGLRFIHKEKFKQSQPTPNNFYRGKRVLTLNIWELLVVVEGLAFLLTLPVMWYLDKMAGDLQAQIELRRQTRRQSDRPEQPIENNERSLD